MKLHKLLLLTSAAYVCGATAAFADPVSLIAVSIQGFLLTSTAVAATATGTIATLAANAIVYGTLAAVSYLATRRGGAVDPADVKTTFESGESSVIEGIGRVRVSGLQVFGNTDGSTRWRVVARLQGPTDGVEAHYVGGREVVVDPDGSVTSPPWARRTGGSWMKIEDKLGTGAETAWPALVSAFPDIWTAAHRVRGIAQSLVTYVNPGLDTATYMRLYQSGVPNTEELQRASLIYDPRDESQSVNTPTSWKWSDNGILVCAHVLRRDPAFSSSQFDWDLIAEWADAADVLVATKTGTEKRARVSGMWAWESERGATMQQFLDSIGAEMRMTEAGKIYFELIGDQPTAEIDFSPLDIKDYDWRSGPEAIERPNICRVEYYSPERNYEMAEINLAGIAWAIVQDEVDRYGPKYFELKLPFCPSASQAQRIARRKFALARADHGVMQMNMVGLAAWGLLYGEIEEPDTGDIELIRMGAPEIDDDAGLVMIPFSVWPALAAWVPATDEAAAPDPVPELGYTSDIPQQDPPSAQLQVTYPGGAKEFRIAYTLDDTYETVEANYRSYTAGLPNAWTSMTEATSFAYAAVDVEGLLVDSRVRVFENEDGSAFSELLSSVVGVSNTTPIAPIYVSGGGGASLDVTVKAGELRVVAMRLQQETTPGVWTTRDTQDCRPQEEKNFTAGPEYGDATWRIQCLTSNGTAGAALTYITVAL